MNFECLYNYLRVKNFKNMFSNTLWTNTRVCFRYFKRRKWDFLVWKPFTALQIKWIIVYTQLRIFIGIKIFICGFLIYLHSTKFDYLLRVCLIVYLSQQRYWSHCHIKDETDQRNFQKVGTAQQLVDLYL